LSEHPKDGHVYKSREDGVHWSFVARWKHPSHRDYHVNWSGEYAIIQVYGNFKNELRFVSLAQWDQLFELAWEPATVCKFCGFTRMKPCLVRQTCANLTDYRLEPDDVHAEHEDINHGQ
jgi:hypothetical protein